MNSVAVAGLVLLRVIMTAYEHRRGQGSLCYSTRERGREIQREREDRRGDIIIIIQHRLRRLSSAAAGYQRRSGFYVWIF